MESQNDNSGIMIRETNLESEYNFVGSRAHGQRKNSSTPTIQTLPILNLQSIPNSNFISPPSSTIQKSSTHYNLDEICNDSSLVQQVSELRAIVLEQETMQADLHSKLGYYENVF